MKIPKTVKIVYGQMPTSQDLSQQISASQTEARMQKPQGGADFWCKSLGRGMVMAKIDSCIMKTSPMAEKNLNKSFQTSQTFWGLQISHLNQGDHIFEKLNSLSFPGYFKLFPSASQETKT